MTEEPSPRGGVRHEARTPEEFTIIQEGMLRAMGDHAQADTLLHRLAQSPNPRVLGSVGERLLRQGLAEEATRVLREALRRAGDDAHSAETVTNLGAALLMSGRSDEAEAALHRGTELGSPLAASNLAALLLRRGDTQGADRLLLTAAGSGDIIPVLAYATFLRDTGRHDEAHDRLRVAAETGELPAAALLGSFLADETPAQDLHAARHWLTMAARSGDTDSELRLGRLLESAGDLEQARRWLTRAAAKLGKSTEPEPSPAAADGTSFTMRVPERSGYAPSAQAAYHLGVLHGENGDTQEGLRWLRLAAGARVPDAVLLLMDLDVEETPNDENPTWAGLAEDEPGTAPRPDPASASESSGPPLSDAILQGSWYVLPEQGHEFRATTEDPDLPSDLTVGGWPLDEEGRLGPFETNPHYVPDSVTKATDPVHALLRLFSQGEGQGSVDRFLALLRHTVLEVACGDDGQPLLVTAPDGTPCLPVVTAAIHTRRLPPARWERVLGRTLPEIAPRGVDILLNPGDKAQFRLLTEGLRSESSRPRRWRRVRRGSAGA
ncbi:type VII secretion system-associated protein [Streptomyces flavochromogenes]|uniref:Type VII secretion system-associated protein n=1 Tax=Streptomyces flavochromogenes TaxID=68199 RepID=A0ABW6Y0T2_9ACTN|nr:type VII secretion system-associated protein [Streptomyces flavochromogenes]